jgi:chlorobactene glucosyltransferase
MLDPLFLYALTVISVLVVLLSILVVNLLVLPRLTSYKRSKSAPRVVALVPARNEDSNLADLLPTLLKQDYPEFEVWVYDDASTDETPVVLKRLTEAHSHLRVITASAEPPAGWLGKAHACYRLYDAMRAERQPEYMLFTDADVALNPQAVRHAVAAAEGLDAGLLSVFPRQITGSWAERLAVPLFLHWAVYSFLPLPLAFSKRTGPAFAAANGQFMLFKRDAYETCGGHEAVRDHVLEDVALARAVKKAGYRALLADGGHLITTRMYNGPGEVWRGYSKNAYAFFGYSPFVAAIGILVLLILYVAPIPLAIYSLLTSHASLLAVAAVQYGLGVLPRLLLAWRFNYSLWDTLLHPLAVLFQVAIIVNSMVWAHTGKGSWKGRAPLVR